MASILNWPCELEITSKHLPGRHDQKTHGRRGQNIRRDPQSEALSRFYPRVENVSRKGSYWVTPDGHIYFITDEGGHRGSEKIWESIGVGRRGEPLDPLREGFLQVTSYGNKLAIATDLPNPSRIGNMVDVIARSPEFSEYAFSFDAIPFVWDEGTQSYRRSDRSFARAWGKQHAIDVLNDLEFSSKHLPGQHDQRTHGRRGLSRSHPFLPDDVRNAITPYISPRGTIRVTFGTGNEDVAYSIRREGYKRALRRYGGAGLRLPTIQPYEGYVIEFEVPVEHLDILNATEARPRIDLPPEWIRRVYEYRRPKLSFKATQPSSLHESLSLNLQRLVKHLYQDKIGLDEFRSKFLEQMRKHYEWGWRYGVTSVGEESPSQDAMAVERLIDEQARYLNRFVEAIKAGQVSEARALQRAQWYADSLLGVFGKAKLSRLGEKRLRWVYAPEAQHCATCLRLNGIVKSARDWLRGGILPKQNTECGPNCRCRLVDVTTRSSWIAPIQTRLAREWL